MNPAIRLMTVSDLDAVDRIQRRSFAEDLLEGMDLFEQIITAYPQGNFLYETEQGVGGYLVTNPIPNDMVDGFEGGCPSLTGDETRLYLHDLCLDPDFRGQGIAQKLCAHLWDFAKEQDMKTVVGVAVQDSFPFWRKMGFVYLDSYDYDGVDGILMEKTL